jgi:hypothetical protein
MKELYFKALDETVLDSRLETGIFDVLDDLHLTVFREYLLKEGVSVEDATLASNKLAEAGKHPERQAYNVDGLLVTFPSPEHKQRAIARGSHFEINPKKAQVNIFGADQSGSAQPATGSVQTPQSGSIQTPQSGSAQLPQSGSTVAPVVNADVRTPEEKQHDAAMVVKMLTTEYSLEEATNYGFYNKQNTWYNSEGVIVGTMWYEETTGKQIIKP